MKNARMWSAFAGKMRVSANNRRGVNMANEIDKCLFDAELLPEIRLALSHIKQAFEHLQAAEAALRKEESNANE